MFLYIHLFILKVFVVLLYNDAQRAGLYAGWELVFRPPTTAAD